MQKPDPTENARLAFVAYCKEIGSFPTDEEEAILNCGREFLPPFAVAVLDKTAEPSAEYYGWLLAQTTAAQAEHDAEYAAGREATE